MNDQYEWMEKSLDGLEPPGPPPELRNRVLGATTESRADVVHADRWTRLWQNRALRLAWAASVVGLVAAHLLISVSPERQAVASPQALNRAFGEPDAELVSISTLPRFGYNVRPLAGRQSTTDTYSSAADAVGLIRSEKTS